MKRNKRQQARAQHDAINMFEQVRTRGVDPMNIVRAGLELNIPAQELIEMVSALEGLIFPPGSVAQLEECLFKIQDIAPLLQGEPDPLCGEIPKAPTK